MGFIQNFNMKRERKADAKIIEKIKKLATPNEIFSAIRSLKLEESVMQVFHLLDESHVYDKFKSGKYKEITTSLENPAVIFEECLKKQENRYAIFQWLYENGMTTDSFQYCFMRDNEKYFFAHITNPKYQEEMLEQLYDKSKLPNSLVFDVLSGMDEEKRDKFMAEHTLSDAVRLKIDKQILGKIWIDKTDDEIKDLLTSDKVNHDLYEISHAQAREFLEKFGNDMTSANLRHCISEGYLDNEKMEVLSFYKDRMNSGDLNSLFEGIAIDYRNMKPLIEQFADEMQESTLLEIFKTYNTAAYNSKLMQYQEDNEDTIPFAKHAEEEPHFLYDMAKLYYDKKLEEEQFEAKYVNFVIAELLLPDQLKFASEYKEKMPMIAVEKIEEAMFKVEEELDTKDILANYQEILSRNAIIALINAQPFKEKMELIKSCNLSEKEKAEVIAFAKKENKDSNVSFLELAMSAAELGENGEINEKNNLMGNQSFRHSDLEDSEKT